MEEKLSLARLSPATRYRHYGRAGAFIGFGGLFACFVTFLFTAATGGTGGNASVWTSLIGVGRQLARDSSFLLPTLLALEAILIGIPLAQARSVTGPSDGLAKRATAAMFATAAVGFGAELLVILGAMGDAPTARRLWSVTLLVGILVAVAFWAADLVLATPTEKLALAEEVNAFYVARSARLTEAHPAVKPLTDLDRPGRDLLRLYGASLLSIWLFTIFWFVLERLTTSHQHERPLGAEVVVQFLGEFAVFAMALCIPAFGAAYFRIIRSFVIAGALWGFSFLVWAAAVVAVIQNYSPLELGLLVLFAIPLAMAALPAAEHHPKLNWFLPLPATVRCELRRLQHLTTMHDRDIALLRSFVANARSTSDEDAASPTENL